FTALISSPTRLPSDLSGNLNNGNAGAATIQQVGQVTPQLDPILQNTSTFGHLTQPQANTVVSQRDNLVQSTRTYNTTLQIGLLRSEEHTSELQSHLML